VAILPKEAKFEYEYTLNTPWLYEDLIAPNDFPIIKTKKEIEQEKADMLRQLKPIFYYDEALTRRTIEEASRQFDSLWVKQFGFEDQQHYRYNKNFFTLTLKDILKQGVINIPKTLKVSGPDQVIILVRDKVANEDFIGSFLTVNSAFKKISAKVHSTPDLEKDFMKPLFLKAIVQNVKYDKQKTEESLKQMMDNLSPYRGMVVKGQRIIAKGEIINKDTYRILQSLQKDYESRTSRASSLFIILGETILISMPMIAFFLYLFFFREDILEDNKNILMILFMITTMAVLTRILVIYHSDYVFILPLMLVPIVIRAFYDTQLALITHVITIILVSFFVPSSFQFLFIQLITGLVTIISIRNLQERSQFFQTAIIIFITYTLIYTGMILVIYGSFKEMDLTVILYFAISATLTFFAFPAIYVLERLFMFVTDMSLKEYADTNNTLIRELAEKAPGTFQHSIQVSNLAEEAIRQIGGNALLVRAGAMYHDIGKGANPMFFTENQNGSFNPHDELTFQESAKIIIGHVLKGVEIAKKHNIPDQIIDFIRTHHGTKRVEYFYRMYKKDFPEEDVRLADFTYHGPIPYSKETCVLMMADAVEAASRSIKSPDAKSINDLVDNIIKSQMDQGQYNNANITMREISVVKKIFKRKLMNIYHVRIEYPSES
jgi:putative nucleotidyltransferase with HDIG domain